MTKVFKPLLAATVDTDALENLKYPLLASVKLDGVRVIIRDGVVLSRNLKPIRNKHVQKLFGHPELEGVDGELIVGPENVNDTYNTTVSGVMREEGEPDVRLFAFDYVIGANSPYDLRHFDLSQLIDEIRNRTHTPIQLVEQVYVNNESELVSFEQKTLSAGFEGVMIRAINAPYKNGRSTLREGTLMKLKRFSDSEAEIIGFNELLSNQNAATVNALGRTERSSHKENQVPMDVLGSLIVRDVHTGVEFEIGTGFDAAMRDSFWKESANLHGAIVKYKYFAVGVKDRPRFPVFIGFRDKIDM